MAEKWENVDPEGTVPDYTRAYADGFIDALDVVGYLRLEDRYASPERDAARDAVCGVLARLELRRLDNVLGPAFDIIDPEP